MTFQIRNRIIILIITDHRIADTVELHIIRLLFLAKQFIRLLHTKHVQRINMLIRNDCLIIKVHRCRCNNCLQNTTGRSNTHIGKLPSCELLKPALHNKNCICNRLYIMDLSIKHRSRLVFHRLLRNHNKTTVRCAIADRSHDASGTNVKTEHKWFRQLLNNGCNIHTCCGSFPAFGGRSSFLCPRRLLLCLCHGLLLSKHSSCYCITK
ncbi:unknown [Roseburia sp. CAG:380]|nr:unknown [Roseburia sp. CAG:380]